MRAVLLSIPFRILRALRPQPPGSPRTFLVLQYAMPLGCCVHGTPVLAALKAQHPEAKIVVAARATGAATLQHDPHIDHLIETADPLASKVSLFAVAQELRRKLHELNLQPTLILADASSRSGTHALFAALLRLAPTAGFGRPYDHSLAYDPELSLIDNNLRLTALTGPQCGHIEPAVYFTAADLAVAQHLLSEANPEGKPTTAFVMQGSGGQRTGWHDGRFAEVIRHIAAQGHTPLYLGTSADAAAINRIRTGAGGLGQSLAGRTTISQLAALLCLCDLVITVDTGTLHLARASATPVVVLGPSWQKPLEWLPLKLATARILRGRDRADVPASYKLDEIIAPQVIAAATDLLTHYPPSAEHRAARATARLSEARP